VFARVTARTLTSACSGRHLALLGASAEAGVSLRKELREACLRFDIYGRYQLEVIREGDSWKIYRLGVGTRAPVHSLAIPPKAQPHELEMWLDDLLHELAEPGHTIRRVG
jgi:hypothetical protein